MFEVTVSGNFVTNKNLSSKICCLKYLHPILASAVNNTTLFAISCVDSRLEPYYNKSLHETFLPTLSLLIQHHCLSIL